MASANLDDPADLFGDDGDDGLFGDEDDDVRSEEQRRLSDEELDSGDDEGRDDRAAGTVEGLISPNDRGADRVMDASIARQMVPLSTDGELHMLHLPAFLGLDPKIYDASTFAPPVADHHSSTQSSSFSASTTASTTVRYRKNSRGKLESNAIMSRWSDGTFTVLLGDTHYILESKPLAPSTNQGSKSYQDYLDSHQYLATPYVSSQLLQIVGHVTNQFTVRPNKEIEDQALERLESSLAAATRGRKKGDNKDGLTLISSTQDPELQKKQAEMAEKERMKAQRRRDTAALRADQQAGRFRGSTGGGLSLDDLERGSRIPGSKKKRTAPAGPRRARRRADYSSDEDDLPRGRNREDEYDLEDDFLAPSDEEIEEGDGGDESEEEIDEGSEDESPKAKKQKLSKSEVIADSKAAVDADSDADAEGEIDDAVLPLEATAGNDRVAGRGRQRLVIEDDEDD